MNIFFVVFNGTTDRKKEAYWINDNFLKTNKVNKLSLLVQLLKSPIINGVTCSINMVMLRIICKGTVP